jgi:hypothetical protein
MGCAASSFSNFYNNTGRDDGELAAQNDEMLFMHLEWWASPL